MSDLPREYDREWIVRIRKAVRQRFGYSHERGDVTRFVVQLEYCLEENWEIVVRYDHDTTGPEEMTHDVATEGLHMDIYREGVKVGSEEITGPIPADIGFATAEEHLATHCEQLISRFEQWHRIDRTDR